MDISAPLWLVVAVAALGVAGTLLAALVSQVVTARREAERAREQLGGLTQIRREELERDEARAAADEQRRQQQAAAARRERLLAERRTAYAEMLIAVSRWQRYIGIKRDQRVARNGATVPIESEPYAEAVDRAYTALQILGGPAALEAATKVHHNLYVTVAHLEATHFSVNRIDEGLDVVEQDVRDFVRVVREELDIDPVVPQPA